MFVLFFSHLSKMLIFFLLKSLAELEALCTHLYIGTDLTQRIEAEKALLELIDSPECLSKCQLLLEQGTVSIW